MDKCSICIDGTFSYFRCVRCELSICSKCLLYGIIIGQFSINDRTQFYCSAKCIHEVYGDIYYYNLILCPKSKEFRIARKFMENIERQELTYISREKIKKIVYSFILVEDIAKMAVEYLLNE